MVVNLDVRWDLLERFLQILISASHPCASSFWSRCNLAIDFIFKLFRWFLWAARVENHWSKVSSAYVKGILIWASFGRLWSFAENIHFKIPKGPGKAFAKWRNCPYYHLFIFQKYGLSYLETCARSKGKLEHTREEIKDNIFFFFFLIYWGRLSPCAQAELNLLNSSNTPASAFQVSGTAGVAIMPVPIDKS